MNVAKVGLRLGRVMWGGPTPLRHTFDMAAVVGTRGVEHGRDNRGQEFYLAQWMASTSHRMFRKRTAGNLDDAVVFDDTVADLLSCLEVTPLHNSILNLLPCHGIYPHWFYPFALGVPIVAWLRPDGQADSQHVSGVQVTKTTAPPGPILYDQRG